MLKFQWMNLYKYCSCLKREKRLLGLRRLGVRVPYGAPNQKDTREGVFLILYENRKGLEPVRA